MMILGCKSILKVVLSNASGAWKKKHQQTKGLTDGNAKRNFSICTNGLDIFYPI